MSISTNQLKSGNHVEVDGTVYKVLEFQHVNPGKGAAFVRTKLRRASDGAVIDKTFRAGEKLRSIRSEARNILNGSEADPSRRYSQIIQAAATPTISSVIPCENG